MPEIEFEIYCAGCGRALDCKNIKGASFEVDPCEICMDEKYREGVEAGKEDR